MVRGYVLLCWSLWLTCVLVAFGRRLRIRGIGVVWKETHERWGELCFLLSRCHSVSSTIPFRGYTILNVLQNW